MKIRKGSTYGFLTISVPIVAVESCDREYMQQIGDDFIDHAAEATIKYLCSRPTVDEMSFDRNRATFKIE